MSHPFTTPWAASTMVAAPLTRQVVEACPDCQVGLVCVGTTRHHNEVVYARWRVKVREGVGLVIWHNPHGWFASPDEPGRYPLEGERGDDLASLVGRLLAPLEAGCG